MQALTKHHILVVDNERDVLEAIVTSLTISGYAVVSAETAAKALSICEQQPVDLAIIDFVLPRMDGLQLLARIRQSRPLIRSIIISGKIASPTDPRQISEILKERVQADRYLEKPVSGEDLSRTVEELLSDVPINDWKDIAGRMVKGQNAKLNAAKHAAKMLTKKKK